MQAHMHAEVRCCCFLKLIVGKIEARLAAFLALEARTAGTPCKKRGKCFVQIDKRLIRSIFRDLPREGETARA